LRPDSRIIFSLYLFCSGLERHLVWWSLLASAVLFSFVSYYDSVETYQ